jgi:Tol biopolymer transport system component
VKIADPTSARPITTGGFDDRRPAISPDGKVVAFVSNRKAADPKDLDLCFVRLDQAGAQPDCVVDPATFPTRPAWAPSGRLIAAVVADPKTEGQTELALYASPNPNSSTAADWVNQGIVTDGFHGQAKDDQVISAAFSPDGTRLAFSAAWNGAPRIFLMKIEGGVLTGDRPKQIPRLAACELAWRSDSKELAIAVRDRGCNQAGQIERVDPAKPDQLVLLTGVSSAAGNPVWFPVAGG